MQGDQTPSLLSDHRPDYMNNDSSGCALQDCCIVLTGKPLLLLLAAAVPRKECGHLKPAAELRLDFNVRISQLGLLCPRQFVVCCKRKV